MADQLHIVMYYIHTHSDCLTHVSRVHNRVSLTTIGTHLQRQAWLKEALEAISSAPSEPDLLKAALSVVKAHKIPPLGQAVGEDTKNALVKAFDEVIYFIEDLDHAKGKLDTVW